MYALGERRFFAFIWHHSCYLNFASVVTLNTENKISLRPHVSHFIIHDSPCHLVKSAESWKSRLGHHYRNGEWLMLYSYLSNLSVILLVDGCVLRCLILRAENTEPEKRRSWDWRSDFHDSADLTKWQGESWMMKWETWGLREILFSVFKVTTLLLFSCVH